MNETCILDVDECTEGTASCDLNANCRNTHGHYMCNCNDNFTGDGFQCEGRYTKQQQKLVENKF